jgi:predicted amidophosphoribosyltransferase
MLGALVDALLPPACAACDAPPSITAASVLCARCLESVEPAGQGVLACAMFGGAVADAIRRAKFARDAGVARALGRFWVARIDEGMAPALPVVDGVTFVPAPYRRRLSRTFDLPALLANALAAKVGVDVVDALRCTRTDAPLSFGADKAARAAAVSGRYVARAIVKKRFANKALLLVDDVHTTGATLGEAARALEAAGARVIPAAFAVAP